MAQDKEQRQAKQHKLQIRKRKYERHRPHKNPGVNPVKAVTVSYKIKSYVLVCSILENIHSNISMFQ